MARDNQFISSQELDAVIDGNDDFPAAKVAAILLKPILDSQLQGLSMVEKVSQQAHLPQDIMQSVTGAVNALQQQMFDLRKLAIQYPEQQETIDKQYNAAKQVAQALGRAMAHVYELDGISHKHGKGSVRG